MVSSFLGSLIILERAVALNKPWTYLGAVSGALGGLLVLLGFPTVLGKSLILLASGWLVLIFLHILKRHAVHYTYIMMLGALSWLWGNFLWVQGAAVPSLVVWWANFLILTIVGERIELGQILRLPRWVTAIVIMLAVSLPVLGFLSTGRTQEILTGLVYILLSAWLLTFDIARKTIHRVGLPRFAATALLAGYVWLLIGGFLALTRDIFGFGFYFDAFLHSVFIGFIFSMIFAHGPIIFPAIFSRPAVYTKLLYLPLGLLHGSMALRITGDLLTNFEIRRWGGMLNAVAILIFLPMIIRLLIKHNKTTSSL